MCKFVALDCKIKILMNPKYLRTPLFVCFFFLLGFLAAQEKSDQYGRDLDALTLKKRGPNKDYYNHLFIGYGFIFGESESDSAQILTPKSSAFQLGYLWKWRITKWYELGFDVLYHYNSFHIKQDSMKIVPSSNLHKREKIVFNNLQLAPFQRFKFKNKHHSAGIFLDLGVYAGYNYRIKHQTVESNRAQGAGNTKTVNTELKYTEDFSYGLMARIGFNRFVFYGRYRWSNLFTDDSGLPDLPIYEVGVKFGLHQ